MALIKDTLFKGFPANYWTVLKRYEDRFLNKTHVVIGLYASKEHYLSVKNTPEWERSVLEMREMWLEGISLTRKKVYELIKKSVMVEQFTFEHIVDPEKPDTTTIKPVVISTETNFFATAEDDL